MQFKVTKPGLPNYTFMPQTKSIKSLCLPIFREMLQRQIFLRRGNRFNRKNVLRLHACCKNTSKSEGHLFLNFDLSSQISIYR